ncbi:MAG: Rab family GTPase [Promethearchaeota archaeon]
MKNHNSGKSIKVVIIGDYQVGKTSMILRYLKDEFTEGYIGTIGAEYAMINLAFNEDEIQAVKKNSYLLQHVNLNNKDFKRILQRIPSNYTIYLWDLAGQPLFKNLRSFYLLNSSFGLIVFDLANKDTYNVSYWINNLKESNPQTDFFIIGNKLDLVNINSIKKPIKKIENKFGKNVILTSAKTKEGIVELFTLMKLKIIQIITNEIIINTNE